MCEEDDRGSEVLEHGNHGWLVTGQLHGQNGWGFKKSDLVKDAPTHGSGVELRVPLKVSSRLNYSRIPICNSKCFSIFLFLFIFPKGFPVKDIPVPLSDII